MHFDLDQRTASLSVGDFADFTLGPRDSHGGSSGLWRAQLGTLWHQKLRTHAASELPSALFEIPLTGRIVHRGWVLTLTGRIDQLLPQPDHFILREIKTTTRELPTPEEDLRQDYPAYFIQLATYIALLRGDPDTALPLRTSFPSLDPAHLHAELHFVEIASGLAQSIRLTHADDSLFRAQLERVTQFLDLRLRARTRLSTLQFRPPFPHLRAGQETTQHDLTTALASRQIVLFEAPTGFGKTGALLELALGQLRSGRFERILYLTSKATGQLQVMRTLQSMGQPSPVPSAPPQLSSFNSQLSTSASPPPAPVTAWLVRPKREHCIHHTYSCSRDTCPHLAGHELRWSRSGLSRFYLVENLPRDLEYLRSAGREASICPYEITRAALPFNDLWIGDYNYVFSPANRGIFLDQPGFDPARSLLIIDEAHNLPSRVADVFTHTFTADEAAALSEALHRARAHSSLLQALSQWAHFLKQLPALDALDLDTEDDARHQLAQLSRLLTDTPPDPLSLSPELHEQIWKLSLAVEDLNARTLPRLWWAPRPAELVITCLDAATAIAPTLRTFGAVILASATLAPTDRFAAACGLDQPAAPPQHVGLALARRLPLPPAPAEDRALSSRLSTLDGIAPPKPTAPERLGTLNKRATKKLFKKLTSAADLLRIEESSTALAPATLHAHTPWRENSYSLAVDLRVDTRFQQRARHAPTTAATIATLCAASARSLRSSGAQLSTLDSRLSSAPIAVFFPSYAYAESITRELANQFPALRIALQPRLPDLAQQTAWMENALAHSDALLLVLGSSFAEGIDTLGGRITHAMVVGPALPEVNAVQNARLATHAALGRDEAFHRVYQIPGIQKVNQALGRLVRAPGQRARVLLHCARFAESSYAVLLAPEYQNGQPIADDAALTAWLAAEELKVEG